MPDKKVPPPPSGGAPAWAKDSQAQFESDNFDDESKLRNLNARNHEWWVVIYGAIVAFMMVFFAFLFVVSIGFWAWHYLTPWCFLTQDQLSKIQSVIFSGGLGAIVSGYARGQIEKLTK